MRPGIASLTLVALCLLSLPTTAAAQITGTIRGVVTDAQGGVLPGATVTADSPNLHRTGVFATTSGDGRYQLIGLPAGSYEITVTLAGFQVERRPGVRVGLNEAVTLDVKLQLAAVQESVTVTGSQLVEVKKSSLSQEVTTEVIENMPLNGRQFLDLVGLAAGTAARPASSQQGSGVTVFGERSVTNSFLVDGMENNDDYTRDFAEFYIQDVIQEFKVELGGYKAEFGRASGAVANVVTKSGSNDFRFRGFYFGRNDSLDSSNIKGQQPPTLTRAEAGGYAGGPIVKDRTWFFGSGQYFKEQRGNNFDLSRVPQVIKDGWFSPTVGGKEDFGAKPDIQNLTYFGKVNHQFNQQNQLFATTNLNIGHKNNLIPSPEQAFGSPPPGSIALPSTASDVFPNTYSTTARYTTFLTSNAFLESSFRFMRNHYQENTGKVLGAEQLFPGTFNAQRQVTFWLSNASSIGILDRRNDRYQLSETLSTFKEGKGHHDLKVGLDYNRVLLDRDFLPPQTMIVANTFYESDYKSLNLGTVEIQRALTLTLGGKTRTQVHNNVWALFGQDSWELRSGLTLNLGLRYDYASLFPEANKNIAPRIGLAWDPNHDGKTVIRTSYGIYFDQNILELATSVPELGGLQFTSWSQQIIPRGASTFDNPAIGAFGPLQSGGTRWLSNPKFFAAILPQGQIRSSGTLSITGQGQPYVIYDLLGIPVADPKNPPVLGYNTISNLTGGRLTPEQAVAILNNAFPGPGYDQFTWDAQPPAGSILKDRYLMFKFRTAGPGISRVTTLQHPEKTPYTNSFNIGVERQLLTDLSVDAQVFVRRGRDLLAGRVVNLREVPVSASCLGNTIDGGPCNNQIQYIGFLDANVFTLSVKKRQSHRHSFLVNYTYTHAVDNFSTLRVPPKGGETNFLLNNHPELDIGRSLNSPNHVFVASGVYRAPYGIDASGILKASSGAPFNAAGGGIDTDGDEIFDNRLVGTKKGAYLADPFVQLDARFAKEFRLGGSQRNVVISADIFNLLNRANPFRVNTALGSTIGQTIEPLPGREIQLGFRLDF